MTDIVGSTEHAAELGDTGWRELVQQHHALVRAALRGHSGREIDTAGDGFFATFDAPAAAVRCALQISDQVRELGIEIRAGVHVGEVEQSGGKVAGITVPIAARIMAAAGPGEVLVSSTVRDLAAGAGLNFEDRGVRELKGVPGEWHIYLVRGDSPAVDGEVSPVAQERRAAAVRRAAARPIWQRRPRFIAAAVVGLAVILATAALLVWKPWQTPALTSVAENSVGIIDPGRNEVVGEIPVGTRPSGIAVGDGYAWITNTGANTVSQIDLATRLVVGRIDVGREPKGIAVTNGEVWVANSGERTVSRINVAAAREVGTIDVGNAPTAIAAAGSTLWVANSMDSNVVSVSLPSGDLNWATGVAPGPIALAVDERDLWVASEDGAITHLNQATGVVLAEPIRLARPTALALDPESVWIASSGGTVTRIDRDSNSVTSTVDVGASLAAVVSDGNSIWVGDRDGNVYRLDARNPTSSPTRTSTTSEVASLAVVDGRVWLAANASAASHRGGTLRIVQNRPDDLPRYQMDPHANPFYNVTSLEADGLVGLRRVGGSAGATLLPNLATSVPRPTDGGLTYTFQLRPNLLYSNGAPVRASDFRRAIERSFQVASFVGFAYGNFLFLPIVGTEACTNEDWAAVEHCDLHEGVMADDATNTVTFHLSAPDLDFVSKLAHPAAYPVPEGIPMNKWVTSAFPGTGPYTVVAITDNEVRLGRNPNFTVRDAAVRPDGYPDEIVFTVVDSDEQRISMVESGDADYTSYGSLTRSSPELFARVKQQYPFQWHAGSFGTIYVEMNESMPPFDNADVRRAVNFAIDRAHMADLNGGPPDVRVTCQLLPPGFPGYEPYCPYTVDPGAGGLWKFADMRAALRLVEESGTRGAKIIVGPTFPELNSQLDYLASILTELGYEASVVKVATLEEYFATTDPRQISVTGWSPDFVAPSNFLGLFTCGGDSVINHCDPDFDAAFDHALALQQTDPAAALAAWAELDRQGVDLALIAPMHNAGAHFVSERVGNFQYSPNDSVLFDQMWVQ